MLTTSSVESNENCWQCCLWIIKSNQDIAAGKNVTFNAAQTKFLSPSPDEPSDRI